MNIRFILMNTIKILCCVWGNFTFYVYSLNWRKGHTKSNSLFLYIRNLLSQRATFKTGYLVQNYLCNKYVRVVNSQRLFCSKELVLKLSGIQSLVHRINDLNFFSKINTNRHDDYMYRATACDSINSDR